MRNTIIVTGGCGFIGSALCRYLIRETDTRVVNVDKLTYAAQPSSVKEIADEDRYAFERADVSDRSAMQDIFRRHRPSAVMHLAAESHVDRSILGPRDFIDTNIVGTYTMLEVSRTWLSETGSDFRFLHVSTDEVFGSLGLDEAPFHEETAYRPNSPYSASKAASDHLVRAWSRTYGLPAVVTNCSNNYGPFQHPEKLIPTMITRALSGQPLPVYGKGENVRDWLHVEDHVRGLWLALNKGKPGETYALGGGDERRNIDIVREVCRILDGMGASSKSESLISFVEDRPGHDLRYAIDPSKADAELGWKAKESFASGLDKTVRWYVDNRWFWNRDGGLAA